MGIIRVQLATAGSSTPGATRTGRARSSPMRRSKRWPAASALDGQRRPAPALGAGRPQAARSCQAVTEVLGRVQEEQGHYDQQIECAAPQPQTLKGPECPIARFEKLGRKDWYQWRRRSGSTPPILGAHPFACSRSTRTIISSCSTRPEARLRQAQCRAADRGSARARLKKAKARAARVTARRPATRGGQGAGKDGLKDGRGRQGRRRRREGGKDDHPRSGRGASRSATRAAANARPIASSGRRRRT